MGLFRATVDLAFPTGSGGGTNTWHLRTVSTDGTTTEIATLMGLVQSFYDQAKSVIPSEMTAAWDGTALQIADAAPVLISGATPWSVAGTGTSGVGAAAAMFCVTWRTPLATRSGRGRTFLGPAAYSTQQGDGTPTSTALTTVRNAAAALVTASESAAAAGAIVVYSEKLGVARDITGSSVTDQYAILTSRRG